MQRLYFSELEPQILLPLQSGRSYVWFPIVSLEFVIGVILQDNIKCGKIQLMLLKRFNKETAVDFLKHCCVHSLETHIKSNVVTAQEMLTALL